MTDIKLRGPNRLGNYVLFRSATNQGLILSPGEVIDIVLLGSKISGLCRQSVTDQSGPSIKQRYSNFRQGDLFKIIDEPRASLGPDSNIIDE